MIGGRGGGAGICAALEEGAPSPSRKLTEARQLPRAKPSLGAVQGTAKMNINGAFQPFKGCSHPNGPLQASQSRSFHPQLTDGATGAQSERRPRQGHPSSFRQRQLLTGPAPRCFEALIS